MLSIARRFYCFRFHHVVFFFFKSFNSLCWCQPLKAASEYVHTISIHYLFISKFLDTANAFGYPIILC